MKNFQLHNRFCNIFIPSVLLIFCFCLTNLVIAQTPVYLLNKQADQLINGEETSLWENDWTDMTDPAQYWGVATTSYHGMAYLGDDKVLLFGGQDHGALQETWVYDLSENDWSWKDLSNLPDNRTNMGMAHIGGDKVLLFGGSRTYATWLNDTWIYDYSENSWTELFPATSPSKRRSLAMAYIGDDKVLLFGGFTGIVSDGQLDDTWLFDLSENNWTLMNPYTKPSTRESHSMAYLGGNFVLLFGGKYSLNSSVFYPDDTWLYNLSTDFWTQLNPTTNPSGRKMHDMAYIGEHRVVLYGGSDGKDETWVYDLGTDSWTEDMNDINPGDRFGHGFSETSMDGSSPPVLFGGSSLETWVFGGGDYLQPTDLIVKEVAVKDPNHPVIVFEISVQNIGAMPASGGFVNKVYLSQDNTITSSDYLIYEWNVTQSLAPDETLSSGNIQNLFSGVPPGQYYLGVIADANNTQLESNENNNIGYDDSPLVNVPEESEEPEEPAGNMISNWTFAGGMTDWTFTANGGGNASGSVENGAFHAQINNGGAYLWEVNLRQLDLNIVNGKSYTASFKARAASSRDIQSYVAKASSPYTLYNSDYMFSLTADWQTYTYTFKMDYATDPSAWMGFDFGISDVDVYLDNISLVGTSGSDTPGWETQSAGLSNRLNSVSTVSDQIAWIFGWNCILKTVNGGGLWESVAGVIDTLRFIAGYAFDENTVLASGYTTALKRNLIFKTTDGGSNWTMVSDPGGYVNKIIMFDQNNGIGLGDVSGGNWFMIQTTDGGDTWNPQSVTPGGGDGEWCAGNTAYYWNGSNNIWFVSNLGKVYSSTDGGQNWSSGDVASGTPLVSVAFDGIGNGLAGVRNTDRLFGTDGSGGWTEMSSPASGVIMHVDYYYNLFWIVYDNEVYTSSDAGDNWQLETTAPASVRDFDFYTAADDIYGWAVGNDGTILKYSPTGTPVWEDEKPAMPAQYLLHQNYPNPFNPVTTLSYSIPETGSVRLEIYSILGKKIATLIDDVQSPGEYLIEWNGEGQATGMYLCKLIASTHTQTIKLLLMQ
ncbi:carbohydrate binding domain-containing protein [bacterium]|nr:carbohydrate binding domain-containing protein [bacterium]